MAKIKRKVIFLTADGIRHEQRAKMVSEHSYVDMVVDRPIMTAFHADPSNIEMKPTERYRRYKLFDRRVDDAVVRTEVLVYKEKV